ncbi:MAG: electron transfer flavoprotein subunit alpha [Collinsella sp.]|nr:electron transfer flavoprotein subunit alpha [Collinsella sp.]
MSGLIVDAERCIGCARCVRACANGGIVVEGRGGARVARVTDSCILCAACVQACPVSALSIEYGGENDGCDLAAHRDIWVFVQLGTDGPLDVSYELLGRARELALSHGCRCVALLAEPSSSDAASRIIEAGADVVIRCRDVRFASLDAEVHARWIASLARERRPEAILYGATVFGRELAPAIAVRLQTGLTADCTMLDIDPDSGLLRQTRPAFGGNLMATIVCPRHRPQMATVRPGIFPAPTPDRAHIGAVEDVVLEGDVASRVELLDVVRDAGGESISDADVLVVVGRGMGSRRNLPLMFELAHALGGELGCTRPIVEAGWLDPWRQVGQTGVSVAPRLLVSLGVSGAIQHLAGISGAGTVIAVNADPTAPMLQSARYQVVGDCVKVAEELVSRLGSPARG